MTDNLVNKNEKKLPGYKGVYYRGMIALLSLFCTGQGSNAITIIPVAIIYFSTSYLISVLINYDPFMMPPILNIFVLGLCLVIWFYIGRIFGKMVEKLQKKFKAKLKSINHQT